MPTRISAPFPDLDLEGSSIISVDTGDVNAVITGMVVHFTQDAPELPLKIPTLPPLLTYGPEAPGLTR